MLWTELWAAVKLLFSMLPGEINFSVLYEIAWNVFNSGWTKGAFLKAVLVDAVLVFPDARTRPVAVLVLQAMLDLINAAVPAKPLST